MVRTTYAPVPFTRLKPGTAFHSPTQALPERVSLEHPAIEVMDMDDVRSARVGNIVATLKACRRQHAMAVERDPGGKDTLRGLFSTTQIARQLGTAVQTPETAQTFAEIESLLTC